MSEFADAVDSSFDHLYAIATRSSKVNARQFEQFVARIGAPLAEASREELSLFAPSMVQKVYRAVEPAFDATVIRDILLARLSALGGVEIRTEVEVREVVDSAQGDLQVVTEAAIFQSARVISALYASINPLHARSALPLIDFQQESTEMALVSVPPSLSRTAITVMDGPFFSLMPYPSRGLHTLSHVRYTPRRRWRDGPGANFESHAADSETTMTSAFPLMQADAKRFLPLLDKLDYQSSLWETKTVLPQSDHDDSRPILFRPNHGVKGYTCIMGGKLDNVYDALEELDEHRG
jgi:glycine/D-amino acid oxidase-like deaminating enzyme